MAVVDDFNRDRQRIKDLWLNLKPDIKRDLVNIWIDREHLEEMKKPAKRLEHEVIEILEALPVSKKLSKEYRAHVDRLIYLLHKIRSDEEWRREIIEDLDYLIPFIDKIHEAIEERKKLRTMSQRSAAQATPMQGNLEDMWKGERDELRPPLKSFKEFAETTDRSTWVRMKSPYDIAYAIPFPKDEPKSYYIIPNPNHPDQRVIMLSKFYSGMDSDDLRCQYRIEKVAWASSEVMKRANFDGSQVEATWEGAGEKGIAKKILAREQIEKPGFVRRWRF